MAMATSTNLNHLPDDCLRLIFHFCPLRQHLSLRLVCDRWYALLSSTCTGRQSLKLFPSLELARHYCHSVVEYGQQENDVLRVGKVATAADDLVIIRAKHYPFVASLFRNVKRLVLCLTDDSQDLSFLDRWTNITSLTLFGVPKSPTEQRRLWNWINYQLPHLNQLFLFRMSNLEALTLTVPTLKRIAIGHYRGDISPLFQHLGPNCTSIALDHVRLPLKQLQTLSAKLHQNLSHLRLNFVKFQDADVNEVLSHLVAYFPRLRHLDFSFSYSFHLAELIPELRRLPKLTSLRLCLGAHQLSTLDPSALHHLGRLPTIRTLHLTHYAFSTGHDELYFRLIPHVFPHLEVLTLGKHHATPWPLLVQLCELADLPALRLTSEYTFHNAKVNLEANLIAQ